MRMLMQAHAAAPPRPPALALATHLQVQRDELGAVGKRCVQGTRQARASYEDVRQRRKGVGRAHDWELAPHLQQRGQQTE
jgi:hypothetical protein